VFNAEIMSSITQRHVKRCHWGKTASTTMPGRRWRQRNTPPTVIGWCAPAPELKVKWVKCWLSVQNVIQWTFNLAHAILQTPGKWKRVQNMFVFVCFTPAEGRSSDGPSVNTGPQVERLGSTFWLVLDQKVVNTPEKCLERFSVLMCPLFSTL